MHIISPIKNLFTPKIVNHQNLIQSESTTWLRINFGYIEHDNFATRINKENINFNKSPFSSTLVQDEVSLKKYFKEISNQYHLSACVGNAVADALEAELARSKNISPDKINNISRLFIYWNSRNNQRPPAAHLDNGTYICLAFDSTKRYGAPNETDWKYDVTKVFDRPSALSYAKGYVNRIKSYYSINSQGDNKILDIIKTLSSGRSIVFGTRINDDFRNVKGKQVIDMPTSKFIGRHAMIITGWSASKKLFEVRNSWGENWGDKGYCYLTPKYIKSDLTKDLFVATI